MLSWGHINKIKKKDRFTEKGPLLKECHSFELPHKLRVVRGSRYIYMIIWIYIYIYMICKHDQLGKNRVYEIGNMGQHFVFTNTGKPRGFVMCLCVKHMSSFPFPFGDMGMDQYLLIPFLGGWTSIYQLFWCSPGVQGFDTLPYWWPFIFWGGITNVPQLWQGMWPGSSPTRSKGVWRFSCSGRRLWVCSKGYAISVWLTHWVPIAKSIPITHSH